ncbi:hypothetical protein PhCBS80983_g02821 [Powellomyces hirtus]|uniref:AB hydrolase-1 domain-containing protein n=1 Tax=Powellomyces hirtus TaxID=109895 RepID=A0A507E4T5_9FUNG|nr:hypothetical protein PhCBS80983_g02821 [Powellomyces hirtus]
MGVAIVGRSIGYRLWQAVVAIILAVTPLSYIYVISLFFYLKDNHRTWLSTLQENSWVALFALSLLTLWMVIETLWFPYHHFTANRLRARRLPAHVAKSPEDRKRLYERCLEALGDHDAVKISISGWFFGAPIATIRRGNLRLWLAWAMFDSEPVDLSDSEMDEIEVFIDLTERASAVSFLQGHDRNVNCMRLTIDDMQMFHRPFIYYAAISAMHAIAAIFLHAQGFRGTSVTPSGSDFINSEHEPASPQRYFYRPARASAAKKSDSALPIVFIHGIGIGYLHYAPLIARLPRDVDVFLLDWPHVSMRLAESVPTIPNTVASISAMLAKHGHPRASFVAHSLGTAAVSWMIHAKPHLVASTVFMDPIVFLLVDPAVAYNFVYRKPSTVLELLMQYFVARELYIAHSLARHFNWSENILFKDELPSNVLTGQKNNMVILSSHDQIVPSAKVRRYLTNHPNVDLMWFDDVTHGELMFRKECMTVVQDRVYEACGLRQA